MKFAVIQKYRSSNSFFTKVDSRCFHFIVKEDSGNVIGAFSVNGQPEYPADDSGGFLVDQPVVLVLWYLSSGSFLYP